ncbi:MAG TPA: sigma 54-interacting transcriptional regulator [Thermoanaerobaculaceae bacterium]|nr:sigma 54-interacting transcriptional regulator [Thermoanaerobaculaceae bacterium]
MVLLSLESENGSVLTYRIAKSQITVGSSSRNDVVVRSPGVADRHLVMHRTGELFTFVTVDRQAVVLNGERRSRGVLNPGDRLRIGAVTLVFRSSDSAGPEGGEQGPAEAGPLELESPREAPETPVFRSDPAGFAAVRSRVLELLFSPRPDCLQQLVAVVREALPGVEVAVLASTQAAEPVALASVWSGELPRVPAATLAELAAPGRYFQLSHGDGALLVVPITTPQKELPGCVVARPVGSLGDEGLGLLGEIARLLGFRWKDIGREDAAFAGWETEARQRLDALLPGSSQAMQVLRAGLLAAAHGSEPVLICGGEGVGRTESARILAALGPVAGRPVAVVEGHTADAEALRQELFGSAGHPSFAADSGGAVNRARGGVLVIRNADRMAVALQTELAAFLASQQRDPTAPPATRWVITCGEDPLALVQQAKLASQLFMVFSRRMLRVPRLAERREDLPLLIASLLRRVAAEQEKTIRGITLECLNLLLAHSYPGEMAELVGEINRLVTGTPDGEMVRCDRMPAGAESHPDGPADIPAEISSVLASDNLKQVIPQVERLVIDRVMRRVKGNQSKGARQLAISRGALIAKLKEYEVPDYRFLRRRKKT